jgi:hypothetical protein
MAFNSLHAISTMAYNIKIRTLIHGQTVTIHIDERRNYCDMLCYSHWTCLATLNAFEPDVSNFVVQMTLRRCCQVQVVNALSEDVRLASQESCSCISTLAPACRNKA